MDYPQASEAHYNTQAGIGAAAVLLARRTWASLRISDDFDAVWQSLGAKLLLILAAAQQSAVIDGAAYVGSVLDEFGVAADPVAAVVGSTVKARIVPSSLVGVASSGRPLESLLYNSIIDVKQALGAGASPVVALQKGQFTVETIVQTQVADAGRSATSVGYGDPAEGDPLRADASSAVLSPLCRVGGQGVPVERRIQSAPEVRLCRYSDHRERQGRLQYRSGGGCEGGRCAGPVGR
jgi:hypothetical protein